MNGQNPATPEPVIIVGAGPAGCTAALLLAGSGIPVTLLERHTQPHPLPRAVHLDDEAARILHRIGVSQGFLARSRPGSGLRLLDANHCRRGLDIKASTQSWCWFAGRGVRVRAWRFAPAARSKSCGQKLVANRDFMCMGSRRASR
jgi:choline dehydrogenase-like flavoprotein